MSSFILIIHVVMSIALILIVLLQTGKGAGMGAAFGGGASQTLFGGAGPSTFLSRLTTIAAVIFMLTSLGLAYLSSHRATRSVMSGMTAPTTEQTEQTPLEAPVQAKEAPSETAVQPVAEGTDVAKGIHQQPGKNEPTQESN